MDLVTYKGFEFDKKNLENPMKLDKNGNEKIKDKNKKIIEIRQYFYKKY